MNVKRYMILNIIVAVLFILFFLGYSYCYNSKIDSFLKKFNIYNNYAAKSIEIVNVGSSHGMLGIKYDNNKGMNLALASQNYYYDLELLKKYSSKIKKDAVIIIPVSIFSFYNRDITSIDKNYIRLLEYDRVKNISRKDYFLEKYFSGVFPVSRVWTGVKLLFQNSKNNKNSYISEAERKKWVSKIVKYHLGLNNDRGYSKKNAEADLINLVKYIKEKKWKFVLITTPFTYIYNNEIDSLDKNAYQERIYENLNEVSEKIGEFRYLDYSHDERFSNNLEYFTDSDHLNEEGAKYFTEVLLNDIEKLRIERKE